MEILVLLVITNFLKTLFIIIIFFYVIRLASRYFLPYFIQKKVNSMQDKMNDRYREQQRSSRREGEVTIERNRSGKSSSRQQDGEYIDFEEVD